VWQIGAAMDFKCRLSPCVGAGDGASMTPPRLLAPYAGSGLRRLSALLGPTEEEERTHRAPIGCSSPLSCATSSREPHVVEMDESVKSYIVFSSTTAGCAEYILSW
jgi:hypothetical protein